MEDMAVVPYYSTYAANQAIYNFDSDSSESDLEKEKAAIKKRYLEDYMLDDEEKILQKRRKFTHVADTVQKKVYIELISQLKYYMKHKNLHDVSVTKLQMEALELFYKKMQKTYEKK